MRNLSLLSCLLLLGSCHKTEPRELTEDEKWAAAIAAGPTDPVSLKEFVVMPLAAPPVAPDRAVERPEVSFYAPLPDGWTRVSSATLAGGETFVSADGKAQVEFKILSGDPEPLANGLAKRCEDLAYEVGTVNVIVDGNTADFAYANRLGFDLKQPDKPPVFGRVLLFRPTGWPPQLTLSVEGRWLDQETGGDGAVWQIMQGIATQ